MHLPPFVSAVHITESEANAKKLIESVSKWILSSWFSSWFALIFHLPIHQSDEEIGEISEGQISNTGCHKVLVLAFRFLLRKIEGEPACSDQRRTEEFHHSANGRWIKKNRTSFWTYETYLLTDPRYIYDTYPRSNRKQGRGTSVRNSRSYRSRQFGRTLHRNDRLAKEILISTKKAKDLVIWLHRRPNLLIEPMTRDSETMSNCCCLLCVKNIIREKDLPRTGRTFGNAISKLGSAGKRRATLNSHEIPPWRFLLQRASHSRASCTSRQVIFPFTGHVSQAIVNAMIQLISMYVIRFPCTMFSSSRFIYFSFFFFSSFVILFRTLERKRRNLVHHCFATGPNYTTNDSPFRVHPFLRESPPSSFFFRSLRRRSGWANYPDDSTVRGSISNPEGIDSMRFIFPIVHFLIIFKLFLFRFISNKCHEHLL